MLLESYFPVVGGMEAQARNLTEGLHAQNIPVMIVTRRVTPDLPPYEVVNGIHTYRVPPAIRSPRARWLMIFSALPTLIRLRKDYDIILVPGFRTLGITAILMGLIFKKKIVLKAENRGEMSGEFFSGGLKQIGLNPTSWLIRGLVGLRNRLLKKADALVSVSQEITHEYLSVGMPSERIHLIPQSANPLSFFPASLSEKEHMRERLNLPRSATIATYTGRLVSYKGLPLLMSVWKRLSPRFLSLVLLVVGAGGVDMFNYEETLKKYITLNKLQGRVIMTGAVSNVGDFLRASDLYVFPSENEGQPLSVIEAMACGLPVVTTSVDGMRDMVVDHQNGLLVPPGDETRLETALVELLTNQGLQQQLGQNALIAFRDSYTLDTVTKQYVTLFSQLTKLDRPSQQSS